MRARTQGVYLANSRARELRHSSRGQTRESIMSAEADMHVYIARCEEGETRIPGHYTSLQQPISRESCIRATSLSRAES